MQKPKKTARKPPKIHTISKANSVMGHAWFFVKDRAEWIEAFNKIAGRAANDKVLRHIMKTRDATLFEGRKKAEFLGNTKTIRLLIKKGSLEEARQLLEKMEKKSLESEEKKIILFAFEKIGVEYIKRFNKNTSDYYSLKNGIRCLRKAILIAASLGMKPKAEQIREQINKYGRRE